MKKQWVFKNIENKSEEIGFLTKQLNIDKSIIEILFNRGVDNFEKAKNFFRPNISNLHTPFLFKDIDIAIQRLLNAIKNNEKILLYGDYDVDGTCSVACLYLFIKYFFKNADVHYYIPNRLKDGYGLTKKGYEYIVENNINLLITLDCGIKSTNYINLLLKNYNIETIICDHHLADEDNLPNAIAILNPKQKKCLYPFKELCACGVTFKFIEAIILNNNLDKSFLNKILDLVTLATSADIVPLIDENRVLVFTGLKKMQHNAILPIKSLKKVSKIDKQINNHSLVFSFSPRINAAARMDNADKVMELFLCTDEIKSLEIATQLDEFNLNRRNIDKEITINANEEIKIDKTFINKFSIVLYNQQWHKGVLGIIASRLVEEHHKPSIIFTETEDNILVGSARSIEGLNIVEALNNCSKYLLGYGGHYFAAGLQLKKDNYENFKIQFENEVKSSFKNILPYSKIEIDTTINFNVINEKYLNLINQLEPYGPLNLRPIFSTTNVEIQSIFKINEKHLKLKLFQSNIVFYAVYFNSINHLEELEKMKNIDIVYELKENIWQDKKYIELILIDYK